MTNRLPLSEDNAPVLRDHMLKLAQLKGRYAAAKCGRRRVNRRRGSVGQGLIEFALVAPLTLTLTFATIDFGRMMYIYVSISSQSEDAKRLITLAEQENSDCYVLQHEEGTSSAYTMQVDPKSKFGDADPSISGSTTVPPNGIAYIYLWPAIANPASNCSGTLGSTRYGPPATHQPVKVQIQYHFIPLTPLHSLIPGIVLTSTSDGTTEY